ncbi:DegT/DnrJ/EryC1/StrS aminotransferase family protein [Streptomyces sp. MBT53]|uniref:DegT/DnrJ/EryC1/StrS family aminotransferase n=1 Tax=Streptomyces sp. MBT53 TaxID=1488384 RepID=UPI001912E9E5|nr:DegT/DnrJ/EryC1/StrS aminotransferase family protein [Streptomyces sp. MBT53]MBK6013548.1 DegT/DnrJ/EryC1/StrS aminotransferase family protein [Streptomyces sp. MBT53]
MTTSTASVTGAGANARPYLFGTEDYSLLTALHSGHYNHSDACDQFETQVADVLGVTDAVAVSSGTAALHVALLAAGIGPGDEVVVPSFTFCATVQAVLATGATPRFADVDPITLCTQGAEIAEALTPATRAVLPVLYAGRAVNLSAIRPELDRRGITVIEDAAHAFGSAHDAAHPVGATGDLTCFSFGPVKNLTCGQGGMVIPRSAEEAAVCRALRSLGITDTVTSRADMTSYPVSGFGLRVQMPSLNAAIGLAQLPHLPEIQQRRRQLWQDYAAALEGIEGIDLVNLDIERTVPHLCAVRVPHHREHVFRTLRAHGIGVGTHYPPNHLQPAFASWHRPLPVTEQVGREILTLPFHLHLHPNGIAQVADALRTTLSRARP